MTVKIEIIAAPGCAKCAAARHELRAAAQSVLGADNLLWREVNVLEELDYAVTLGVLSMPAVAINGELKFSSLPTAGQLRAALTSLAPH